MGSRRCIDKHTGESVVKDLISKLAFYSLKIASEMPVPHILGKYF